MVLAKERLYRLAQSSTAVESVGHKQERRILPIHSRNDSSLFVSIYLASLFLSHLSHSASIHKIPSKNPAPTEYLAPSRFAKPLEIR